MGVAKMTKGMMTGWTVALAVMVSNAHAGSPHVSTKIAGDLRQEMSLARESRVIVSFAPGLSERDATGAFARSGKTGRQLGHDRLFAASLNRREIEALASDPRVASVSPDRRAVAADSNTTPERTGRSCSGRARRCRRPGSRCRDSSTRS